MAIPNIWGVVSRTRRALKMKVIIRENSWKDIRERAVVPADIADVIRININGESIYTYGNVFTIYIAIYNAN